MKVGDLVKYQEYVYIPPMRPQLQMTTGKGVGLSGKMGIILEYDSTLKIANIQFVREEEKKRRRRAPPNRVAPT